VAGYPSFQDNTASGTSYGLYLEDLFTIHRNLSIRAGARVDQGEHRGRRLRAVRSRRRGGELSGVLPALRQRARPARQHRPLCAQRLAPLPQVRDVSRARRQRHPRDPRYARRPQAQPGALPHSPNTNVSPRLSVTWDPGTNGRFKLFGTAGRYFGETFLAAPIVRAGPPTASSTPTGSTATRSAASRRPAGRAPSTAGTISLVPR
jgi:hypothetical protein